MYLYIFFLLQISSILAQTNGFCNLVWNDEFSGSNLDSSKWMVDVNCAGGGNNELQCYTNRRDNVFIEDGSLVLRAKKEKYTGSRDGCTQNDGCTNTRDFTSGRVSSRNRAFWTYGRFETRAKLVSGSHLWPAIWMMPQDSSYGGWAASGEIDIMEARGQKPRELSGTLHHGGNWPRNIWTTTGDKTLNNLDLSDDYHVYTVEWTRDQIKWFVDSYNFQTLDLRRWWNSSRDNNPYSDIRQPFDKNFYMILNLAIGGNYFGGYPALTDADVQRWKVPELRIDYVRVWTSGGDCSRNPFVSTTSAPTSQTSQTSRPQDTTPPTVVPDTNAGTTSGDLCGDVLASCVAFCAPSRASVCDCDPVTGKKTVLCANGNNIDDQLNNGDDGTKIPGSSDRTWMEKNGAILFGVIAGVVGLALIAAIVVVVYMKKKKQFDVNASSTQNVHIW